MGLSSILAPGSIAKPGVCTSSTRPASPYTGQIIYETDTGYLRVWDGAAWGYMTNKQSYTTGLVSGNVLQVVNGSYSSNVANSTNTLADTGLSASITPSSTTNKILVIVHQAGCGKNGGNTGNSIRLELLRGSTSILTFENLGGYTASDSRNFIGTCSATYLDSPATTSSTTYKTQFRNLQNAASVEVQANTVTSTITLMEIQA